MYQPDRSYDIVSGRFRWCENACAMEQHDETSRDMFYRCVIALEPRGPAGAAGKMRAAQGAARYCKRCVVSSTDQGGGKRRSGIAH